nr:hypothetical protein [Tanacetum cinerariifolium]
MNYLEEQTDGEAMINSIKNGDQPLPRVTQVSIAETSSTEQPPLKDKSIWSDQENTIQKIDYDFSELKKITALLAKAFNQRKLYSKPTNNNLRTSSTSQSANKKQEFVKTDDKKVEKKDDDKKRDMSKVKCYKCKTEGHFAKDCKKFKVKDHEYYKTKMLLAKKDKDEQVLLAEDQAWMESSNSEASSSSADDKIFEVSYYLFEFESESEYETLEYYDNTTTSILFVNDNDDQEIFHDCENYPENLIESQINHNESAVDHNDSEGVDNHSKLNKDVKRYSCKDLLSCNNSHLGETSSAYDCNDAINVSCNSRFCDSFDENNLFIFDDESVRISPVSKMPFRKMPRVSMNVRSKSNSNKSLPRTMH